MAKCAKGIQNAHFSKGQKQRTPLPTWKSTRDRRHHYTTLTNASTSLLRQSEHSALCTHHLPGLLDTYTRYWVFMTMKSRALLTLL